MDLPAYPKLRPGLEAVQDENDLRFVYLFDNFRLGGKPVRIPRLHLNWVALLNGSRSRADIQAEATLLCGGIVVAMQEVERLIAVLDEALLLDSQRFHDYLASPVREPSCVGCYPEHPQEIRAFMRRLFTGPGGAGLPGKPGCRIETDGRLRAALVPHIDYRRGGATYGWGFKEIAERTDAALFVIIGTSHCSKERFTLTRKNFKTPLGTVPTDQAFIDRLVAHYGAGLFADPFAHLPEHSIELEVLLLQFLYEAERPFRIVPLVVGPFSDCVEERSDPNTQEDIRRMVKALKLAEAETPEPVCYLISGDLAHVGPKFGDPDPVDETLLTHSHRQDHAILDRAAAADAGGYFRIIAAEEDARRICGLPPTFVVLEAAKPSRGRLLHHGRYVHPAGYESVSFASVAFDV